MLCTFAIQTVVCGNIAGILNNPVSVSLSESSLHESIVNRSVNYGSCPPACAVSNASGKWPDCSLYYMIMI